MKAIYARKNEPMRVAALMSGEGSNLRKILEIQKALGKDCPFRIVLVFTDTKDERKCNAKRIAEDYGTGYYCNDIKEYYEIRGKDRKDMEARKEYDSETARILKSEKIDAVAMCGYGSITTEKIFKKFVTVNVHPADLRILDRNGKKLFAGCRGAECVRKAAESDRREMRATTHLVTEDVDCGPILMVSGPVKIDDKLSDEQNLEMLKEQGDWKVYPETIKRLAEGRFLADEGGVIVDVLEEKAILREGMRRLRERLSDSDVKKKSGAAVKRLLQLEEYEKAKTVMFYMGVNKEVKTEEVVKAALEAGKTVAVPVTDLEKGRIAPVKLTSLNSLKPGAYGILEPAGGKELEGNELEVVIVPGLAFDAEGNRIGYGLGFYDRFLRNTPAKRIALAYEMQIVDRVLPAENDVPMDLIVTEERVIRRGA